MKWCFDILSSFDLIYDKMSAAEWRDRIKHLIANVQLSIIQAKGRKTGLGASVKRWRRLVPRTVGCGGAREVYL